ncbi:hypothetical protein ACHAXR_007469 [Thalassiosira sp. AJA248-18]
MDGLSGMMPQGAAPSDNNQGNSTQNSMGAPDAAASNSNPPFGGDPNYNAAGMNMNSMGMAGMNNMGMLGNPNMNMGGAGGLNQGINPNDLNSVMNAVLMNNALQQQAGGMNPLVLQSMMSQGMIPPQPQMAQMLQPGMMNPGMGGMMGGMGMPGMNAMGMNGGNMAGANNNNPAAPAPSNNEPAPAPNDKAPGAGMDNISNDLFAQIMQNPMAAQMMAQGINPMMLLGNMGGGPMGQQSQFGAAANNPLGALGLGMNGLGGANGLPPGLGNNGMSGGADGNGMSGGLNLPMMANSTTGDGATAPHPNALFAFNNPAALAAQDNNSMLTDGVLKQPISAKQSKKQAKKMKVKGKPKRPLSAYNFFFREERSRILESMPAKGDKKKRKAAGGEKDGKEKNDDSKKENKEEAEGGDNDSKKEEGTTTKGSSSKPGDKDYDQVGDDGKKIPHGKIGFENLAKLIGKRWQELDADGVEKYKKLADQDMTRYKKEMEVFLTKEAQAGSAGGGDGDLMAPSFYSMLNQKRHSDGDDKPKKKRSKTSKGRARAEPGKVLPSC